MKDVNKIWREFLESEEGHQDCSCDTQEEPHNIWFGQLGEAIQDTGTVFKTGVINRPSTPKLIVIHYTLTSSPKGTVAVLNKKGYSTHYEVDQAGEVHEYVDPGTKYTWHARWTNKYSIGIDITSRGSFSPAQVEGVKNLVTKLCNKFGIPQVVAKDGVKYKDLEQVQADGVGILRHRNITSTKCPGNFPMEKLGAVASTMPDEEGLDTGEKEDITADFAKAFGFDKFGGFLDKIVDYVKKSTKIDTEMDIANLFKQISSKMGLAEEKINENMKRFNDGRNRNKRYASKKRQ